MWVENDGRGVDVQVGRKSGRERKMKGRKWRREQAVCSERGAMRVI